jgi:hypothetical protein
MKEEKREKPKSEEQEGMPGKTYAIIVFYLYFVRAVMPFC